MRQFAKGVLAGVLGASLFAFTATAVASHIGVVELGHDNAATAETKLTGSLAQPVLRLTNNGSGYALAATSGTSSGIRAHGPAGIGVFGTSDTGFGLYGQSTTGMGVRGVHQATTGGQPGIEGLTASIDPSSVGVLARNTGGGFAASFVTNGAPPFAVNSTGKVASLNADLVDGLDGSLFLRKATYSRTAFNTGTNFGGTNAACVNGDVFCVIRVDCDAGDILANGGVSLLDDGTQLETSASANLSGTPTAWLARWRNNSTVDTVQVVIHCWNQ
jgi:hypothetical protein